VAFVPNVQAEVSLRPKWLSLSVGGVVAVAAFAVLAGLSAPMGLLFSRFHPLAGMPMPPETAKIIALQQQMFAGPAGIGSLVVGIAGLLAGAWCAYTAIRVLSQKPGARVPFRRSVIALVVTENASLLAAIWLQAASFEMFEEFAKAFAAPAGSAPSGFESMMRTFMQGAALVSIVVAVGWGVVKLAVLVWTYRYTGTKEVVEYLER